MERFGVDGRATPSSKDWTLGGLQQQLWRRRWLVLLIAAEVFLLAGLVTLLQTRQYRAAARVLIERSMPNVLDAEDVVPVVWNEFEIQRFYQTQYLLVRDPAVLERALETDGLREALIEQLSPEESRQAGDEPPSDKKIAAWLRSQIEIAQKEYSNVVEVSFENPSPELAASVVNAAVEAYRDFFVATGIDAREGATEFLADRIEEAQAEVLELEKELARRRLAIRAAAPSNAADTGETRLAGIDSLLTAAKARRANAEARVNAYELTRPADIADVREDSRVTGQREDLRALEQEAARLGASVGESWPRLVELRRSIETSRVRLEAALEEVYVEVLGAARADLELARQSEARLTRLLDRELTQTTAVQLDAAEFEGLRALYEQKRRALDRLLERREEVAVSTDLENMLRRQVTVLAYAEPPGSPSSPRVKLNLGLGLLLGIVLGFASGWIAEALDNKIRSSDHLQELTGLPHLGSIPRVEPPQRPRLVFPKRAAASTTPLLADGKHDVDEAFRAVRSALLLAQPEHPPRTLLVTSALPGEGKSTIAANLARTLASFGQRVLLIDADLRHPRLHRVFDIPSGPGLTNALASAAEDIDELVIPTSYPNLSLLRGGPCPPDPATLLESRRLRQMLDGLTREGRFDVVLIDTPPVLVFSDSFNIVPVVEGTLLVARAMHTPKEATRQALVSLRKVNARLLGTLLNGEITDDRSGAYYRHYHYRRGGYERRANEVAASRKDVPRRASGS